MYSKISPGWTLRTLQIESIIFKFTGSSLPNFANVPEDTLIFFRNSSFFMERSRSIRKSLVYEIMVLHPLPSYDNVIVARFGGTVQGLTGYFPGCGLSYRERATRGQGENKNILDIVFSFNDE